MIKKAIMNNKNKVQSEERNGTYVIKETSDYGLEKQTLLTIKTFQTYTSKYVVLFEDSDELWQKEIRKY